MGRGAESRIDSSSPPTAGHRKVRPAVPIVDSPALDLRSKVCTHCKKDNLWRDYHASKKWPDGTMRAPQARCKRCQVKVRVVQRRANPEHMERHRADNRARYARRMRDPEQVAIIRDQKRESNRRRFNIPRERWRVTFDGQVHDREKLPGEPFRDWLMTLGPTPVDISEALGGVDQSWVGRYLHLRVEPTFGLVDKYMQIAYARGVSDAMIGDIYPEEP